MHVCMPSCPHALPPICTHACAHLLGSRTVVKTAATNTTAAPNASIRTLSQRLTATKGNNILLESCSSASCRWVWAVCDLKARTVIIPCTTTILAPGLWLHALTDAKASVANCVEFIMDRGVHIAQGKANSHQSGHWLMHLHGRLGNTFINIEEGG